MWIQHYCVENDGLSASGSNGFISSVSITEGQMQWLCHSSGHAQPTHTPPPPLKPVILALRVACIQRYRVPFCKHTREIQHLPEPVRIPSWMLEMEKMDLEKCEIYKCKRREEMVKSSSRILEINCISCEQNMRVRSTYSFWCFTIFLIYGLSSFGSLNASLYFQKWTVITHRSMFYKY